MSSELFGQVHIATLHEKVIAKVVDGLYISIGCSDRELAVF